MLSCMARYVLSLIVCPTHNQTQYKPGRHNDSINIQTAYTATIQTVYTATIQIVYTATIPIVYTATLQTVYTATIQIDFMRTVPTKWF